MNEHLPVTEKDIVQGLAALGVGRGDVLMVHSSLSSFGRVERAAEAVIAAVQAVLGPEGTLMMPSFGDFRGGEYGKVQGNEVIFDVRTSPSRMGRITDVFWRLPGVRRSLHPTHSIAAWGKLRDELLAGHERCRWSCGYGTPLHMLKEASGKILLAGVDHRVNTFIHTIEDTGPTPSTSRTLFEPKVIDYDGNVVTVPTHPHLPGLARRFRTADAFCRQRGLQRETRVGAALLRLVDAAGFYAAAAEQLAHDPLYFLDCDYYAHRR